jgi:hypothetical protein
MHDRNLLSLLPSMLHANSHIDHEACPMVFGNGLQPSGQRIALFPLVFGRHCLSDRVWCSWLSSWMRIATTWKLFSEDRAQP